MLGEAERGFGGRMMSVGVHSRWSGQAHRASALRDFVEYALGREASASCAAWTSRSFWIEKLHTVRSARSCGRSLAT